MKQLFPPSLSDVLNCSLSNAILKVGIDATVGELLLLLTAMGNEGIVCEVAVVCLILFNDDVVVGDELFEC